MLLEIISQRKKTLDSFRPFNKDLEQNLTQWIRTELTYTSNAIEGNTLTRQETELVINKGITIAGKTINEHLEARNHAKAFEWILEQSKLNLPLTEIFIKNIHQTILSGINTENAGRYRQVPVRISGSTVIMPNYVKIPDLMKNLIEILTQNATLHPVTQASEAHYHLVSIHPFIDGNGRTARLLMNHILMLHGYPPAVIGPSDRITYINSLEEAQLGGSKNNYEHFIQQSVLNALENYLESFL